MRNLILFGATVAVFMSFIGGKAADKAEEVKDLQETRLERIERSLGQ